MVRGAEIDIYLFFETAEGLELFVAGLELLVSKAMKVD